jgi:putative peptide zinc metalloprotease protein
MITGPEVAEGTNGRQSISLPEYPELDQNVELVGEMQDTAFNEPQWLVQRDGRFIQVSQLLYRVAEQMNGERTFAQIAERVTDSTEWLVTEDNVRQIIEAKLMPLGVVAAQDDAYLPYSHDQGGSPFRLYMRKRVVGPHFIELVTRVFQFLFAPVVLIPAAAAIAVAHWWLYFRHGLEGAIIELVLTPGLMLLLIPIILLSAVFHEFGHASALRYGGGKARGMGVGFYLIYPAFYTDTTDSYRLGRWAKLRTDLGGIYFHLVFALGIVGLYLLTGFEFLLIAVFVINFEAVRQLIPFVRFDGYWILADLTGIPEPFTYLKQSLQSAVSSGRSKASALSNLKPWVQKVFVTYVAVTVPLLAAMIFFFIRRIPLIAETVWFSIQLQADQFALANSRGDVTGMALSAVSILILLLQVVGITFMLFLLGRALARTIWAGWKSPKRAMRMGSVAGTAAVVLLLAYVWMP